MAPKKSDKSPSPDSKTVKKSVTIDMKEYLTMQNEIANTLNQYHTNMSSMMMAAGNGMSQITGSMIALQNSTKAFLDKHKLESTPAQLKKFPAIAAVLAKDKQDLMNPLFMQSNSISSKSAEPVKKPRVPRAPKDPNAPKRPQTAYFLYMAEHRDQIIKDNPGMAGKDASAIMTEAWNKLPVEEQQTYKDFYLKNMVQYKKDLAAYKEKTGKTTADATAAAEADEDEDKEESDDEESESSDDEDDEEEEEEAPAPPPKEPTPPPVKTPKGKKGKKAAAAASAAEPTPALAKSPSPSKSKKAAKAKSPEKEKTVDETPATDKKKKRKSIGSAEVEEKRKKRRETLGDDY